MTNYRDWCVALMQRKKLEARGRMGDKTQEREKEMEEQGEKAKAKAEQAHKNNWKEAVTSNKEPFSKEKKDQVIQEAVALGQKAKADKEFIDCIQALSHRSYLLCPFFHCARCLDGS